MVEKRHDPYDDSNVTWAIGVVQGKVELQYPEGPRARVVMDSENARQIAEGIAKAAYEARYGTKPAEGASRLGDELRTRMVARGTLIANTMVNEGKSNQEIVQAIVDRVMLELA